MTDGSGLAVTASPERRAPRIRFPGRAQLPSRWKRDAKESLAITMHETLAQPLPGKMN